MSAQLITAEANGQAPRPLPAGAGLGIHDGIHLQFRQISLNQY